MPDTSSHNIKRKPTQLQRILDTDSLTADWAAFFPEPTDGAFDRITSALSNGISEPSENASSMPNHLAPACKKLIEGIQDLLNYKDDAQLTESVLPQLIKMLASSQPNEVKEGAQAIHELGKKEAPRQVLIRNAELCPAVANVLGKANVSEDVTKLLLGTLHTMSETPQGRIQIVNGHTIPQLVKMLGSLNKKIVQYALSTLHNLECHLPKQVVGPIRLAGGVGKMTEVLVERKASPNQPWSDRFLATLLNALEILCTDDQGSKTVFVSKNGLPALICIIKSSAEKQSAYEKLTYTAIRFLCVLSAYCTIKEKIIEEGGMEVASALNDIQTLLTKPIKEVALYALRNLSDKADTEGETMVQLLISCLDTLSEGSSNDLMKECVVGIISNLTCNNSTNKETVINNNGVNVLIDTVMSASGHLGIKEPAICALRHLTSRNILSDKARDFVGKSAILSLVREALRMPSNLTQAHMGYIRAILSLIRNIVHSEAARTIMKRENIIENICVLLQDAHRANDPSNHTIREFDLDGVIDGCMGALHVASAYEPLRRIITSAVTQNGTSMILFVAQFMNSSKNTIQRESIGCLCELSQDKENQKLLAEAHLGGHSIAKWLGNLLNSHIEAIAAYAAVTLFAIDEHMTGNGQQAIEATIFRHEDEPDAVHEYNDEQMYLLPNHDSQADQYGESDL